MATALLTRFGYPKVPGDQPESIIDVSGPKSYVDVYWGTPLSSRGLGIGNGGQDIAAQDFGLQSLDFVTAMASTDGKYFVLVVPNLIQPLPNPPLPTQLPDGTFSKVTLIWMDVAANQQVGSGTDLSTSTVRLFARGR